MPSAPAGVFVIGGVCAYAFVCAKEFDIMTPLSKRGMKCK